MMNLIFTSILSVFVPVATTCVMLLVNKGMNILDKKYSLDLTDSQRSVVQNAVNTGAGLIQSAITSGALKAENVHTDNPIVQQISARAMTNVMQSATALNVTPELATQMVTARFHNQLVIKSPLKETNA